MVLVTAMIDTSPPPVTSGHDPRSSVLSYWAIPPSNPRCPLCKRLQVRLSHNWCNFSDNHDDISRRSFSWKRNFIPNFFFSRIPFNRTLNCAVSRRPGHVFWLWPFVPCMSRNLGRRSATRIGKPDRSSSCSTMAVCRNRETRVCKVNL